MLDAVISCDVDTLASIYKGYDLRRPAGYTCAEFAMGLENFSRMMERFGIRATLFMVGQDFREPGNVPCIKSLIADGHEIANHSMTHVQGFRLLSAEAKETEIAGMEDVCLQVTGRRPVGFRAPGWNVSDDTLPILKRRGYLYDSSVFPSSLTPVLKWLHRRATRGRSAGDRTTLGSWSYMFARRAPYHTSGGSLGRRGEGGVIEFPIATVPIVRVPFFATFLLATGVEFFKMCYRLVRASGGPIQYQFHLSDFVDYTHPDLAGQVPERPGAYVPQALRTPLAQKLEVFGTALEILSRDCRFMTLEELARKIPGA